MDLDLEILLALLSASAADLAAILRYARLLKARRYLVQPPAYWVGGRPLTRVAIWWPLDE